MTEPAGTTQQAPARPAMIEALGGKRGLVDSGLPAVVFVLVNSVVDAFASREIALNSAIAASVAAGLVIVVLRLVRKETLQQAISGFLGLAVAVFFARRAGEARAFFLPGIFINVGYGVVFLGSALLGRPVVGYLYAAVDGMAATWREHTVLRRAFALCSIGWALVFASRAVVQSVLYVMDRPGLLAASKLLMGWPLTIAAVALTVAYVKRVRARIEVSAT